MRYALIAAALICAAPMAFAQRGAPAQGDISA
jgi:hypothetical protein